jgi:transcriptional regulator with XRE-family HTH domain
VSTVDDRAAGAGFTPRGGRDTARGALASALARLRRAKGLTGQQLGQLAGMSQAKISKIENAAIAPSPRDVERLARALDAPDDLIAELIDQANGLHDRFTDWRLTAQRLTSTQQELAQDEERASTISVFQTAVVPGLLQTTEYARAVLSEWATVLSGHDPGHDPRPAPSAVTSRIQRQEVLYDPQKRFEFIIAEGVLASVVGSPAEMLAQLQRIRTVAAQDNVRIGILPWDADLSFPPMHGFHLFDDRVVLIDLVSTVVVSRGNEDLRVHRAVFDHFRERSVTQIGPIIDRYMLRYAEAARTAAGRDQIGNPPAHGDRSA